MLTIKKTVFMAATALLTSVAGAQPSHSYTDHKDAKAPGTIVEVATAAGFNTLVTAVKAAGLAEALSAKGPFTVFAPTDAAFAKLPAGTLDALLKDKAKLAAILKYHVVSGKVMAADVVKSNGAKPATLNGAPLDVTVKGGKVYVNGAQVTSADVPASNGVIHVIDAVVLPPAGK